MQVRCAPAFPLEVPSASLNIPRLFSRAQDPSGTAGRNMKDEMMKKIEKWQEPPPAKTAKVLPVPDAEVKKRRGGKRYRKMKASKGRWRPTLSDATTCAALADPMGCPISTPVPHPPHPPPAHALPCLLQLGASWGRSARANLAWCRCLHEDTHLKPSPLHPLSAAGALRHDRTAQAGQPNDVQPGAERGSWWAWPMGKHTGDCLCWLRFAPGAEISDVALHGGLYGRWAWTLAAPHVQFFGCLTVLGPDLFMCCAPVACQVEEEFMDGEDAVGLGVIGKDGSGRLRAVAAQQRQKLSAKAQKKVSVPAPSGAAAGTCLLPSVHARVHPQTQGFQARLA